MIFEVGCNVFHERGLFGLVCFCLDEVSEMFADGKMEIVGFLVEVREDCGFG